MRQFKVLLTGALFVGLCTAPVIVQAAEYTIDPSHSTIGFAVPHLQVGTTRGEFTDYQGVINFDPDDLASFKAQTTIQVSSIDTNNEKRDNHLRSGDFFDAENHPTITFSATRIAKIADGYSILGDLTIRGVTKTIGLPVTISGPVKGMSGNDVIGLAGEMSINRQDFGVSWNKTLDTGGVAVGDVVRLIVEIEAHAE